MLTSSTTEPSLATIAEVDGAVECPIGEAVAILMARHDINYTRAFAGLIVSSERIQRSVLDIAAEVIRTRPAHCPGAVETPTPQRPDGAVLGHIAGVRSQR